ncbi:S-type pyocin domain-containing protein [Tenebrionicola larvae]|uniref:S-type pyocin domain-containing protein n=1 Tax=Tenebrionicola larvae TaxID=2815733 RepID=UPI0020132921|nr:S-type pyocin domain-containing protein [Tenebrionicola larvae]
MAFLRAFPGWTQWMGPSLEQIAAEKLEQMCFFRALPAQDPATDDDVPQHAQTARKKKPAAPQDIPKPKKRGALWKWWNGNHEEMNYQAAVATAAAVARAQTATAGASVLEPLAGRGLTYGTWAVRAAAGFGEIAVAGAGASVAGLLTGMMPGRLNDGEQDFIDRMRAEQMREAPTRVRFTWENDGKGNPTPRGWHTPPGKDMVRVRKMEWDSRYQAYTFTTEEEPRITIIWTPDYSGVNMPSNIGNQARPVLPNPVIVDPLADNTGITATTTPAPEEKSFADYILILPAPDLLPIYIYIRNNPGQVTGKGQKVSGIWLIRHVSRDGFTDHVFALMHLLGFDLLQDWRGWISVFRRGRPAVARAFVFYQACLPP